MTAEVAILNKLGIALAADSAVTISEGNDSKKVFNTADKLFELSREQPIACMIFSNLQFVQTPLQVLIKQFRSQIVKSATIADASSQLLEFLRKYAEDSSKEVKEESLLSSIRSHFRILRDRATDQITRKISDRNFFLDTKDPEQSFNEMVRDSWMMAIGVLDRFSNGWDDALLIGELPQQDLLDQQISRVFDESDANIPEELISEVCGVLRKILTKCSPFESYTGLVVAGYGEDEIFPTVEHYDIFAPIMGALKYRLTDRVDICRSGPRARVMAFAQREMAERFLFGLDAGTKDRIVRFCRQSISVISDHAIGLVEFEDEDKQALFRSELSNSCQSRI